MISKKRPQMYESFLFFYGLWFRASSNLQIKQPTRCTFSCKIFYCLNAAQHVSGNILPIIRSTFWTAAAGSGSRIKAEVDVFPAVETHLPWLLYGKRSLRLQFKKCPWWRTKCCPKHVEHRLNNKWFYNWVRIWLVVLFEYYFYLSHRDFSSWCW
jgi:hypothetical protein